MSDQPVIVVATRGGEGSRAAHLAAAEMAKAQSAKLTMLYVVDTSFHADDGLPTAPIATELMWIGSVLLELARKRVAGMGVSAETIVLEGNVRNQIIAYLREHHVTKLFLGAPRSTTRGIFGDDEIEKFAREIEAVTGVKVDIAHPETTVA